MTVLKIIASVPFNFVATIYYLIKKPFAVLEGIGACFAFVIGGTLYSLLYAGCYFHKYPDNTFFQNWVFGIKALLIIPFAGIMFIFLIRLIMAQASKCKKTKTFNPFFLDTKPKEEPDFMPYFSAEEGGLNVDMDFIFPMKESQIIFSNYVILMTILILTGQYVGVF